MQDVIVSLCLSVLAVWIAYGMQVTTESEDDDGDAPVWLRALILSITFSIVIVSAAIYARHASVSELAAAIVGVAAALAVGGIFGFLFGIPRVLQVSTIKIDKPGQEGGYSPNTNLERISDWLTTIIVGLSLVQFRTILGYFNYTVDQYAKEISCRELPFVPGAILMFYGVGGFLLGYLWTRLRLMRDFEDADRPARKDPQYYEGLMNAYLYTDPPAGFQKVISLGEQYRRRFSTANGRIWLYLACAYGQMHRYLKFPPHGEPAGTAEDVQQVRNLALQYVRRTLDADIAQLGLLRGLWEGGGEAAAGEDDLGSLSDDDAFKTLFESYDASYNPAAVAPAPLYDVGTAGSRVPASWSYFNPPTFGSNVFQADTMLLLTDGSVLIHNAEDPNPRAEWYRLTPNMTQADSNLRYGNGTWSGVIPMHNARQFFSSGVLRDGRVYVIGGEVSDAGADTPLGEIFDPLTNTWSVMNKPAAFSWVAGDAAACVLPDGRVLIGALGLSRTAIWDPASNTWGESGLAFGNRTISTKTGACNEETWALLQDGTVMAINISNDPQVTEIYDPATDIWTPVKSAAPNLALLTITDTATTPPTVSSPNELGPAVLLHNGQLFAIGGTGHTGLYDSRTGWSVGPDFGANTAPNPITPLMTAIDAPGCVLPSNRVLCVAGNTRNEGDSFPFWSGPIVFYQYDPVANSLAPLPVNLQPTTNTGDTWMGRLLVLPTGQVLFSSQQRTIALLTPDSSDPAPSASWRPTITGYSQNMKPGNSYVISGLQLNGRTQACSYGDDAQMATNYPIVQVTNRASKATTYLRSYNFSNLGISAGNSSSATIDVPARLPTGTYELIAIANGIRSNVVSVTIRP